MKYILEFEAPDDWKPNEESACWVDCPLRVLTRLGEICIAKRYYDRNGLILCPIIKYQKK